MKRRYGVGLLLAALASSLFSAEPSRDPLARARENGSLTLTDAFTAAAQLNEQVGLAQENLVQAQLLRKTALSQVLPQLTLVDDYYRQNPVTVSGGSNVVTVSDSRNELRMDLVQPLFHGLREQSYLRYARSNEEANRLFRDSDVELMALVEAFQKVAYEQGNVITALFERWHTNSDRTQAVVAATAS